ncbi:MAG: MgtC/SapB family protein [Parcubacteria group bacterium]|nr:MgtC/SapB family protein [Parcubacteria group bacterium]
MTLNYTTTILVIKDLLLAVGLGLVIGLERKLVQGEVGMRTFALICLGATLFVLLPNLMAVPNTALEQFIGQLVVGIGFLGAGAIIFEERSGKLRGLTTAAIMWVTAAIGAAIGIGFYSVAIISTALVLLINLIILPIERRLDRK